MAEFDVSGQWNAFQGNATVVKFDLQQTGTNLQGVASFNSASGAESGTVKGSVSGIRFQVTVKWSDRKKGEYDGMFNINGRITGLAFNVDAAFEQATWRSDKTFMLQ